MKTNIIWPDLTRETFWGIEQWLSDGKVVAQAEYPPDYTLTGAQKEGLLEIIFDDIGVYAKGEFIPERERTGMKIENGVWYLELPEDLIREPFYGGEQWMLPNGRIVARAEYPPEHTRTSAQAAGLFEVIFDDFGIYDE